MQTNTLNPVLKRLFIISTLLLMVIAISGGWLLVNESPTPSSIGMTAGCAFFFLVSALTTLYLLAKGDRLHREFVLITIFLYALLWLTAVAT